MKYSEQFKSAIEQFKSGDTTPDNISRMMNGYWSMLIEKIGSIVRESGKMDDFLKAEQDLIDFGIIPEITTDINKTRNAVLEKSQADCAIQIFTFSAWLSEKISKILQGDKKELLEKEIQLNQIQVKKIQSEIKTIQTERAALFQKVLTEKNPQHPFLKQFDTLIQNDDNLLESIKTKKAIATGAFLSVEKKREHFNRENLLQKESDRIKSLVESLQIGQDFKALSDQILAMFNQLVDLEHTCDKISTEVAEIEKKASSISTQEIESRIRSELEYIRDLVRLSARRLHLESCPVLQESKKFFSLKKLAETLDRILEFDPKLFRNDRVGIFGKPYILLVPGTGSALYDWKNNCIITPVNIPQGDFLASLASGVIEYRIDVDEDKIMMSSYNQLPEMKAIRSTLQLRANLTKDYITWMTSEYSGYRILVKSVKDWFEREIAPSKNEIFTPYKYSMFTMSTSESKALLTAIEAKLSSIQSCTNEELWSGSILYYQQGNFQKSLDLLGELKSRNTDRIMAFYNIGMVASKLHRKQEALSGYQEFLSRSPQSWWTRVAQEQIRKL
jgi:tetratricopeptide (TPR) repeat protein